MSFKYRASDPAIKHDSLYDAAIYRFRELSEVPWSTFVQQPDQAVRIIVQPNPETLPLDMLYIPRESSRLVVGFHGAEDPRNTDFPKFQFVRSFRATRKESLLFLFDTTLLHTGAPSIAWMVGNSEIDLASSYQSAILELIGETAIDETILVGHSAGGTSAIKIGSGIPNSRAVAVNPQFSARIHRPWILDLLAKNVFNSDSNPSALLEQYADRFDLSYAIENQLPTASFTWFTHREDTISSMEDFPHFPAITEFLGLSTRGGEDNHGNVVALCEWETTNKNKHALPGGVLPFLQAVLGEDSSLDLKPLGDTDPTWERYREAPSTVSPYRVNFRGSNLSMEIDEIADAPIYRFESLEEVPWQSFAQATDTRHRIIIQGRGRPLPLDVLYIPRESRRLLIGLHGAEQQTKASLPKFQFVRSFTTRSESLLFLSDSTLLLDRKLSIAWMAGCPEFDVAKEYTRLINALNTATGVRETILVGHSAGGTAAVRIGSQIPNSRTIAVNGQFAAQYYEKWTVPALHRSAFPTEPSPESMLETYKNRLHLGDSLNTRLSSSSFTWFTHQGDKSSFGTMPNFPRLAEHMGVDTEQGGRTPAGDALVVCDWKAEASKHALPGTVMPFISATLGEAYSQDISIIGGTDPRWYRS